MSERFFSSQPITSDRVALRGDEALHIARVMRAKVGDELILFDGSGEEFTGRIEAIGKQSVDLVVVERKTLSRELVCSLTLAVALPKGDRQKWLVEKATELGVTRLIPLVTERGVAQPADSAIARLRRTVIEASKQCGRNRLMEIDAAVCASDYFAVAPGDDRRFIADPSGEPLANYSPAATSPTIIAVGPEGGFSPAEIAAASAARWKAVSLGPRILRVETAAIALAAWIALGEPSFVNGR